MKLQSVQFTDVSNFEYVSEVDRHFQWQLTFSTSLWWFMHWGILGVLFSECIKIWSFRFPDWKNDLLQYVLFFLFMLKLVIVQITLKGEGLITLCTPVGFSSLCTFAYIDHPSTTHRYTKIWTIVTDERLSCMFQHVKL